MSKTIKTIIVLLILSVIAMAGIKILFFPQSQSIGFIPTRVNLFSGTPSYYEDNIYVRAYATTSIIARNVTSSDVIRYIQNVGDQPVTLWLFADATTTQPTWSGGFMRLLVAGTTTGTDASMIDLSWFRGSVYAITQDSGTYLKVLTNQ